VSLYILGIVETDTEHARIHRAFATMGPKENQAMMEATVTVDAMQAS
jgi:hypothetical protein